MFFVSLWRTTKFSLQDIFRNFWLSLVTISIIILTFLSTNVIILLHVLAQETVEEISEKVDLTINFIPEASQIDIEKVKAFLKNRPEVSMLTYSSPEEALEKFREKHQDDATLILVLSELPENPLGASLIVKTYNLGDYQTLLRAISENQELPLRSILTKDFRDRQTLVAELQKITQRVTEIAYGASFVFLLITVLVMFNTVRIAIYTHREEVAIMKLVGASNIFVRAPFILESLWLTLLAFIFSLLLWLPLLGTLEPYFDSFFSGSFDVVQFILKNFFLIFGYQFLLILFINVASAFVAVGKYLKI